MVEMPILEILSREEISDIHSASLEILKRVGCKIDDAEFLDLLKSVGAEVDLKCKVAKLPESLVEESLKKAGKVCRLYGRDSKFDVTLSGSNILGHQSEGATYTFDLETGMHRLSTTNDLATFARLSECLENVNLVMCPVVPQDLPIQTRGIDAARICFDNTTKPCSIAGLAKGVESYVHEMAEIVAGGPEEFRKRPIIVDVGLVPTSPLQFSSHELHVFKEGAKQGLLSSVGSMPQAGGTAPITLAGTLVIQIAEILMGIVLGQLVNPGLAMYALIRAGMIDPRSGAFSSGATEVALLQTAAAQVCIDKYGLCVDTGWAASDSKLMDEQVGYEKAFSWLESGLVGASMVSGMGALETGITQSPAQLLIDDEIIQMVKRNVRGIRVDAERLALDVIENIGIGGTFLGAKHTLDHLTELSMPKLSDRFTRTTWQKNGARDVILKARNRARELLKSCEIQPLSLDVRRNLDEFVSTAKAEIYRKHSH